MLILRVLVSALALGLFWCWIGVFVLEGQEEYNRLLFAGLLSSFSVCLALCYAAKRGADFRDFMGLSVLTYPFGVFVFFVFYQSDSSDGLFSLLNPIKLVGNSLVALYFVVMGFFPPYFLLLVLSFLSTLVCWFSFGKLAYDKSN
jgi:hypothetical protein